MPKAIRNPEIKFGKVGESFDMKSMVTFTAAKSLSASGDCDRYKVLISGNRFDTG